MTLARREGAAPGPERAASLRRSVPALALILFATVWLYFPVLRTPFFADDYLFLDQVRSRPLLATLATPDPLSNFYRPVSRQLYFWLIAHASKESPLAFHVANLVLLLAVIVLLFALVRRLAGDRAAPIAAAFLGLHYSADVTVRWACGSQDLLAVLGALAAIHLHLSGRRLWAGAALLLAMLSKEVVLLAPVVAVVAGREAGERWPMAFRRAWPLAAAIAIWGLLWVVMPNRRAQQGGQVELIPSAPLAAPAHLGQVIPGLEWRRGEVGHFPRVGPPLVPLALALAAVGWGASGRWSRSSAQRPVAASGRAKERPGRRRLVAEDGPPPLTGTPSPARLGLLWAFLAIVPVAAVTTLWSAYYYLFAICGVALALGAWLASRPRAWALAAIALLSWGSASARSLEEFAEAKMPWTAQSHINRLYIERAVRYVRRYLEDLKRQRPELPPRSTLFFAGLKGSIAFQAADGPLVRWAYRDSSLKSYYLTSFSLDKARRGPMFFFTASGDSLHEMEGPGLLHRIAFSMLVTDQPAGARDALLLERQRDPTSRQVIYLLAWAQWAAGDTAAAVNALRAANITPDGGPVAETAQALAAVSSGDTLGAIRIIEQALERHGLDAGAHGLLADLRLMRDPDLASGAVEALAARLLAPRDPYAWRRWGMVQAHRERFLEALTSFDRYFRLGGAAVAGDQEAKAWVARIRSMVPGGGEAGEVAGE